MILCFPSHLSKIDFKKTSDLGSIELLKTYKPEPDESVNKFSSIFGQILQIFSKKEFYKAVIETRAERGASGNNTDLDTALIAILILKYLKFCCAFNWSLSNLVAMLRYNLFTYRDLWEWINKPIEVLPFALDAEQLFLRGI